MVDQKNFKDEDQQGYIQGTILYTIFQNKDENFSIVRIKIEQTNESYEEEEIVIKGHFSKLKKGNTYLFYGQLENHSRFGLQYDAYAYKTYVPSDREGLINYLSSDLFYGVGVKTAERIIDHLGINAIQKILDHHEVLYEVPRLPKKTAETIIQTLERNQGFEKVVIEFTKHGIGLQMSRKIYEKYHQDSISLLQNDPYQFVFDIEGFSFPMAEQIAKKYELEKNHPNRMRAAFIHIQEKSIQDGHVYLPVLESIKQTRSLLDESIDQDVLLKVLQKLDQEKKLIIYDENVYLPSLYYAEDGFSANIQRILRSKEETPIEIVQLMKIIGDIEEEESLNYGPHQFEAIQKALQSKLMIVTGGPGTGKTTVIKGILKAYAHLHELPYERKDYEDPKDFPFILAAPTGRAAQRLSESTGLYATTIHRLLGWNGEDYFEKDENNPLQGQYIVIDEFSMVDIWLAHRLFKAIPDHMKVLLIGDEDQLPSVGPGQVLSDLLQSELLPSVSLTEVYRQQEGSKIIELAHEIKNNQCTEESLKQAKDFNFISCSNSQVIELITNIFNKAKERGMELKDLQVLAPMYRTNNGIHALNKRLQEIVNPPSEKKREVYFNDYIFRVGDKVIQLVNQPEDKISNGDIGEIIAIFKPNENIDKVEQVVIDFEGKEVVYERSEYINIMHAYCISIHKSQGSEFPNVILPIVPSYHRMLKKNLLYTAITRSKQSLILCGNKESFLRGIQTFDHSQRNTSLTELLIAKMDKKEEQKKPLKEDKEITPYDFM